jgi:hypothetical protein
VTSEHCGYARHQQQPKRLHAGTAITHFEHRKYLLVFLELGETYPLSLYSKKGKTRIVLFNRLQHLILLSLTYKTLWSKSASCSGHEVGPINILLTQCSPGCPDVQFLMGLSRFWGRRPVFQARKNGTTNSPVFQQCCFFITDTGFSLRHASSSWSLDA